MVLTFLHRGIHERGLGQRRGHDRAHHRSLVLAMGLGLGDATHAVEGFRNSLHGLHRAHNHGHDHGFVGTPQGQCANQGGKPGTLSDTCAEAEAIL